MDVKLETVEKKVLVEIVKLVQKRGLEGTRGGWKEFLSSYDKKFGASLSDPAKRSNDVLVSFLKAFTKDEHLKLFNRVLQSHLNKNIADQLRKRSPDNESPEQRLVRLTLEHPLYPLDYSFPTDDEEWIVTKLPKISKMMKSDTMLAVDCEMVQCEDGTEALVKVCVVDRDLQVKMDELVKPKKAVADYRTEITGVAEGDLDGVTCSVADIQKSIKLLLSKGTILVGHGLHNDLQVLKIDHARVVDTSYIFKYSNAPIYKKPSLNNLCKSVLGYEVRKQGAPHNCLDDATATMKLVLAKLEHGDVPLVREDVPKPQMEKLLLHKIPINVRRGELSNVIPGAVAIEVKQSRKVEGCPRHYSAYAIFNNSQEANQAYENIEGAEEKDSYGLSHKLVRFHFGEGKTATLFVRKMAQDDSQCQVLSNKRPFEVEEKSIESKKHKTDQKTMEETMTNSNQLDDPLKDIERLKQELKEKDARIVLLEKSVEEMRVNSNKPDDQSIEIDRLKKEVKEKDAKIALQEKMISKLVKKVDKMKRPSLENKFLVR